MCGSSRNSGSVLHGALPLLVVALGACYGEGEPGTPLNASGCPQLDAGEPGTLQAGVRVLSSEASPVGVDNALVPVLLSDGGDVYWRAIGASVFVARGGAEPAVELWRHEDEEIAARGGVVRGIAAGPDRLYVSDAFLPPAAEMDTGFKGFEPPSRLLAISKLDGQAEVLLELDQQTIAPISADAEGVIVFVEGEAPGFHRVRLADRRLERLPLAAPFESSRLHDGKLYWLQGLLPPQLLRAGLEGGAAERVHDFYPRVGDVFALGPDHILSLEPRILPGYFWAGTNIVVNDGTSCRAFAGPYVDSVDRGPFDPEPGPALTVDAQHAYWYGDVLRSAATSEPRDYRLFRLDLDSGVSAQLETPGFVADRRARILGQDAAHLYVSSGGTLVAIEKP